MQAKIEQNLTALEQEMNDTIASTVRLTQYSHGAGCGCKISPKVLEKILHSDMENG